MTPRERALSACGSDEEDRVVSIIERAVREDRIARTPDREAVRFVLSAHPVSEGTIENLFHLFWADETER